MDRRDVEEILKNNHEHHHKGQYQKRSWNRKEIEDGENYFCCRTNPFPWLSNVYKTSWFCKYFHWLWWCHDLEKWEKTSFPYYYILCRKCGRCWMAIRPIK